jgi:hypothetical protein
MLNHNIIWELCPWDRIQRSPAESETVDSTLGWIKSWHMNFVILLRRTHHEYVLYQEGGRSNRTVFPAAYSEKWSRHREKNILSSSLYLMGIWASFCKRLIPQIWEPGVWLRHLQLSV